MQSKIKRIAVGLILFLSATQLGLHIWPASAFIHGIRIDYLAPTVYLLDGVIVLYLFLIRRVRAKSVPFLSAAALFPVLAVNLLYSHNPLATISWVFHLTLYVLFFISVSIKEIKEALPYLIAGMVFQVVLGIAQVLNGQTAQGVFYWLGERALNVSSPNVAKSEWFGEVILRAYGTFSHPNTLAGWLVVCTGVVTYLLRHSMQSRRAQILVAAGMGSSVAGVALADSRAAAISLFGIMIPLFLWRWQKLRILYGILIFMFIGVVAVTGRAGRDLDLSVNQRFDLQKISLQLVNRWPVFGTGVNASISTYPVVDSNFRLYQPDHNSLMLSLSWLGIVGVVAVVSYIQLSTFNLKTLLPLLPLLLLDHYLLTSTQGIFVLIMYLKTASLDQT